MQTIDDIFQTFFKKFRNLNFHSHIWIRHEKRIKMSTNKPRLGSVFFEIASVIFKKVLYIFKFGTLILSPKCKALNIYALKKKCG